MARTRHLLSVAILALVVGVTQVPAAAPAFADGAAEPQAQPAPNAPEMSAEQVLRRSALAYLRLKSYSGTSAVISMADFGDRKLTNTASAQIQFERPGKWHMQGLDTGGHKFGIISDGDKSWRSWATQQEGEWQEEDDVKLSVASMTGVAALAPTVIFNALGDIASWPLESEHRKSVRLDGRESIGGEDCQRVVAEDVGSTWTLWISSRDFLMRQARQDQGENQMAEQDAQARQQAAEVPATAEELLQQLPEQVRKQLDALPPRSARNYCTTCSTRPKATSSA